MGLYYDNLDPVNQRVYQYFKRARQDCNQFIETGCNVGNSLRHANDLGYQCFSCDINKAYVDECRHLGQVYHLPSVEFLKVVIPTCTRSLFWLDAHDSSNAPIFEELEIIASSTIKDHVIMIDDLPIYFSGKYRQLEETILKINPDYRFEYGFTREKEYILYGSVISL